MIVDQFDEMVEQCVAQPLVMTLSLHPFVVGQPFRLPSLRKALKHCVEHAKRDRVWWTTPGQVADYCYALPPGTIPGEGPQITGVLRPAAARSIVPAKSAIQGGSHMAQSLPQRPLGKSGINSSAIGLGCMSFSGVYGPSEDAAAVALIHEALEPGITMLDSSDAYGKGQNETLVGNAIKGRRVERGARHQVRQSRRRRRQISPTAGRSSS